MTPLVPARTGEALAAGRIVVGAAAWLAPRLSARVMGMEPGPAVSLSLRLFGIRDVAVGVGYLQAGAEERRRWLVLGMVMDGADAVAAVAAARAGGVRWRNAVLIATTASAAALTAAGVRTR